MVACRLVLDESTRIARIRRPTRVPPGSWARTGATPSSRSRAASSPIWVVLPEPSIPSKLTKNPCLANFQVYSPRGHPSAFSNDSAFHFHKLLGAQSKDRQVGGLARLQVTASILQSHGSARV